ncbi:hypothetical protein BD309DRAFT_970913 [Dichomitus squalens]|nr:hypothetical protein BD309DRAFT_970913 [Dichomitus squalens]
MWFFKSTRRVDSGRPARSRKGKREIKRDKRSKKLDEGRAEVGTRARDLRKLVFTQTATD